MPSKAWLKDANESEEQDRILVVGRPNYNRINNMVRTSKYTALNFIPIVSFS